MIGPLEIGANAAVTASILLAGRNSVHTWWTGIIGCLLFALVFYSARLYADVVLQIFFVGTSVIGWWRWKHGNHGHALAVSHANFRTIVWMCPVALLASAAYGAMLHYYTDAYAPFVDSAVLVFSVVAQLLLMQRRMETWAFWLIVNTIAVPLYASRELHLTAALYVVYWVNALIAWRWWHRLATQTAAGRA